MSVLVDFDGTISLEDVGDALLARFVDDQVEVERIDRLWREERLGSRETIRWDMDVLPQEADVLRDAVDSLELDETLGELVAVVRTAGAAIEVVSDGIGFHVEAMLARLHLGDLPVATNAVEVGRGGSGVAFPYGHPACFVCGTCKRERVRLHRAAGRAVVFVGDGMSDRYAAHHADVLFAKAGLAAHCDGEGIAYQPWQRLSEVAEWLESALSDGSLARAPSSVRQWQADGRAKPAFICGPEVWGDGRTVPLR